ncbi:hypothetical protein HCN52_17805, partial [Streptomyces bohaiensis]|nr:hypothetical protein [Streptomyces bohaiensis]
TGAVLRRHVTETAAPLPGLPAERRRRLAVTLGAVVLAVVLLVGGVLALA